MSPTGITPPPSPWPGPRPSARPPARSPRSSSAILELDGHLFDKVEIAGPGFLNFTLGSKWYGGVLADIQAEGETYGAVDEGRGEKVMVEFVSANPTGPMHIGNARGGVLGDALAAVLERAGYDVWREFYVNDAGNQIHKFAMSIDARYLQLVLGEENYPFPEDGYHGDDIKELARGFYDQHGAGWKDKSEEERQAAMAEYGLSVNIPKMKEDLAATRSNTISGSWSPDCMTAVMWPKPWACWPARAGPTRRTALCGSTPPPCSSRSSWSRARPRSRWTSST